MKVLAIVFIAFSFAIVFVSADSRVDPEPNITSQFNNSEILGGVIADIRTFPWQVAILEGPKLRCSGVLIARNVVLASAHCVPDTPIFPPIIIRVGSTYFNAGGRLVKASRADIYSGYKHCNTCFVYDMAIIYLDQTALARGIPAAPIVLWDSKADFGPGTVGTIFGWGKPVEGGIDSLSLRRVTVPLVASDRCRAVYGPNTICVKPVGGRGVCSGDAGSPLVIQGKLAGISAFANGCGSPGKPVAFTSVPALRDWILQKTGV